MEVQWFIAGVIATLGVMLIIGCARWWFKDWQAEKDRELGYKMNNKVFEHEGRYHKGEVDTNVWTDGGSNTITWTCGPTGQDKPTKTKRKKRRSK